MSAQIRHILDDANMDDEDIMRIMSIVKKQEEENEKLKEENEELKERVSEWKKVMGEYADHDDPWPSLVGEWICDQTNEFEEDIEKLQERVDEMEEENEKLKQKTAEHLGMAETLHDAVVEENNKLKEKLNSIQGEIKDVLKEEEKKTNTKNVKGNRKIVSTEYCTPPPTAVFKIPDGVDLEDKSVVEYWYVKYGTLHIKYVGKEEVEEIECHFEPEIDWKVGNDEIVDADEWCVEYTDDEEED